MGHGDEPLDQIMFNPANWRIHPKEQQTALEGVLSEVGWVQDVIVNKRTGNLIDGHLRCQVAARNDEPTIPVVYVDLSEDEEAIILASLDPLAAMAATDKAKLEELLHQVHSDDERVQQMMADVAEREGMFGLPSLDELEAKYGDTGERDLWPFIRVQVSPETMERYKAILNRLPGKDESERFDALISGYELQ